MTADAPIAATSTDVGDKHTKRLLPPALASVSPHGPINKPARSAGEQAALDKRKNEILQSMSKEQITAAYSEQAVKINEHLQKKVNKHADIDNKLNQLKAEHDMEIRVIKASLVKQDDEKRGTNAENSPESEKKSPVAGTGTDDGQEEGEIEMTG